MRNEIPYNDFVKRMHAYRKSIHLSQEELSRRLGVTQSYYSKQEKGTVPVSFDILVKLHCMGCDIDYMITGEENPTENLYKLISNCSDESQIDMCDMILSLIIYDRAELMDKEIMTDCCKYKDLIMKCKWQNLTTLHAIRLVNEITQEQIAEKLAMDVRRYRKLEKSSIITLDAEELIELYKAYGILPSYLQSFREGIVRSTLRIWNRLNASIRQKLYPCIEYNYQRIIPKNI